VKKFTFAFAAAFLSLCFALALAESVLRVRVPASTAESALDPGLFQHDTVLGWRLTPYWKGSHRHHDYTAAYAIDGRGFRRDPTRDAPPTGQVCVVLGDSFTFGFGVGDDETFVQRLDASPTTVRCVNLAVPGYSTDQEVLLLEQALADYDAIAVLMVVYLGNDLIDNERPFPIQVPDAKPYFSLTAAGLELRNSPVPREKKPAVEPAFDLLETTGAPSWLLRVGRFEIGRALAERLLVQGDLSGQLDRACASSLNLFDALMRRARQDCAGRHVEFHLVLMPGRSLVEKPSSLSAKYQDHVRREIVRRGRDAQIDVIDLCEGLKGRKGLYYPNDGHLTREGHEAVAEILFAQP
jgi:hypothetical protein